MKSIDYEALSQHSHAKAMAATARLFGGFETKWPQFYLQVAINHLIDDLLQSSLHVRRLAEFKGKKINSKIVNSDFGVARSFDGFESDYRTALGRIIHHKRLTPIVMEIPNFYKSANPPMSAFIIPDFEVESDQGVSKVNVVGFAAAATNELSELSSIARKVH